MMEEQNIYDAGWYDGIEFGLTMKDVNQGIVPEDNQSVLIYVDNMFLPSVFYPICCQENNTQYNQRVFLLQNGQMLLPGYVRYWMPMPMLPEEE